MKCKRCGSDIFKIREISYCSYCKFNGWLDEKENIYSYEELPENIEREQVLIEGECKKGITYGNGCTIISCAECGYEKHIPFTEEPF